MEWYKSIFGFNLSNEALDITTEGIGIEMTHGIDI
jgi:hypothetical protein